MKTFWFIQPVFCNQSFVEINLILETAEKPLRNLEFYWKTSFQKSIITSSLNLTKIKRKNLGKNWNEK